MSWTVASKSGLKNGYRKKFRFRLKFHLLFNLQWVWQRVWQMELEMVPQKQPAEIMMFFCMFGRGRIELTTWDFQNFSSRFSFFQLFCCTIISFAIRTFYPDRQLPWNLLDFFDLNRFFYQKDVYVYAQTFYQGKKFSMKFVFYRLSNAFHFFSKTFSHCTIALLEDFMNPINLYLMKYSISVDDF